jgi:hypothetical protein
VAGVLCAGGGLFGGLFGGKQQQQQKQQQQHSVSQPSPQPVPAAAGTTDNPEFPPYQVLQKGTAYDLRFYEVYPVVEMDYQRREEGYLALGSYQDGANSSSSRYGHTQPVVMCYHPDVSVSCTPNSNVLSMPGSSTPVAALKQLPRNNSTVAHSCRAFLQWVIASVSAIVFRLQLGDMRPNSSGSEDIATVWHSMKGGITCCTRMRG